MARLTAAQRKKLPKSTFKGPKIGGKPSFPMPDKAHATAALRLVGRARAAGHITAAQEAAIRADANKLLGKRGGK
jgi:hypothetical protein